MTAGLTCGFSARRHWLFDVPDCMEEVICLGGVVLGRRWERPLSSIRPSFFIHRLSTSQPEWHPKTLVDFLPSQMRHVS